MLHIPGPMPQGLAVLTLALNGGLHQRVPHSPPCRYQSTSPLRRKHPLAAYSKVVRSVTERYNLVEPGLPVSPLQGGPALLAFRRDGSRRTFPAVLFRGEPGPAPP